nr:hypothetical protein [Tanacetum cinerariifolium]
MDKKYTNTIQNKHEYETQPDALDTTCCGLMLHLIRRTWVLGPRPANVNIVRSMWIFKHKFNADGSLSSLVVKPATIRTVLSLAMTRDWPIRQLDVKNAFLNGQLSETVYMHQQPGFVDSAHPNHVCQLQRSFIVKPIHHYLFITGVRMFAYLLLYVDDIVLTASSTALLQRIITLLHNEFAMTDLDSLNYFLGISAQRSKSGLFLSQSKFAEEILERAHMQHCNPCKTPVDTESKLGSDGDPICLYMHDPRDPYFSALKRILRYVRGTINHELQLHVSSTSQLTAYTDADWDGCPVTRRSTSSVEAEYRGVANVVAETAWLRNLLLELHAPLSTATLVYCDNVSAVYLFTNPVQHQHTKHIEIDIHFVQEYVASGQVRVLHVPFRFQSISSKSHTEEESNIKNLIEKGKDKTENSPGHDEETHGTSNDIDEDTPVEKVKGPGFLERAKEEIEAVVEAAVHPNK